jgi:hydrogenase-4 component B
LTFLKSIVIPRTGTFRSEALADFKIKGESFALAASWDYIILISSLGLPIAGSIAALLSFSSARLSRRFAYACSLLASIGFILSAVLAMGEASALQSATPQSAPTIILLHGLFEFTDIAIRLNGLSAFFLLIIGLVGFIATIYAIGFTSNFAGRKSLPLLNTGMLLFLFAMAGVVTAGNVFTFLVAWEVMSVVSYLLVVYFHERPEVRVSGFVYLVMTHVGTAFLTVAFFILQHYSGSFVFDKMTSTHLPQTVQLWVFVFVLIGFGTKAGLVPLHIWLPRAYASAPSPIAAVMSGAMIKTAVYGYLLVMFSLLPNGPAWWGAAVLAVGAFSAIYGVLHAMGELDHRRVLAYSSIENLGLIFMGMGAAYLFLAHSHPVLASLALFAVLVHSINHALFKSLLFMGSGSVLAGTQTTNMNLLGGLIRRMPWTALFVLLGCLAIAAMPPLNGFVSEWLLFQSLFALGAAGSTLWMRLFGTLAVAVLALVGALAAFLFVRFFATQFLAKPRSEQAENAHEASLSMRLAMALGAACCVTIGVFPAAIFVPARQAVATLLGPGWATAPSPAWSLADPFALDALPPGQSRIAFGLAAILLAGGALLGWLLARAIGRRTRTIRRPAWASGWQLTPRMTYTASGFSKPIRVAFRWFLRPSRRLWADVSSGPRYFTKVYAYKSTIPLIFEERAYLPVLRFLVAGAGLFRRIQNGVVQSYLLYLLATLVILLIWIARWES